jgi:hypothetical protein
MQCTPTHSSTTLPVTRPTADTTPNSNRLAWNPPITSIKTSKSYPLLTNPYQASFALSTSLPGPHAPAPHSKMSSNASINMSNISPAESLIPLPFPHPPMPAPPAMSLCIVANTLHANNNLNKEILRTITNRLLSMIAKRETNTALIHHRLNKSIHNLQEKVCHYEETFNTPPPGYSINANHLPHLCIPVSPNLY